MTLIGAARAPGSESTRPSGSRCAAIPGSGLGVSIFRAVRTVVLTVSSSVSRRETEDTSGTLLAHLAEEAGAEVVAMEVVPDDFSLIEDRLHHYVDEDVSFVFTTGGTGLTHDDITPEATRAVIEREAPGIAEAMRDESAGSTRRWACSAAAWPASPGAR